MDRESDVPAGAIERPNWFTRIGWLVLIWIASVTALLAFAFAFRTVMGWVGLST